MPKPITDLKKAAELAKEQGAVQERPVEKSKEKTKPDLLFEYINNTMNGECHGIGIHSIRWSPSSNNAAEILRQGLKLKDKEGVLSTVSSFGIHDEITSDREKDAILNYSFGSQSQERISIVVLVPSIISNSEGQSMYLGFPEYDTDCRGNNYRTSCVLDSACRAQGKVPSEFILGYFTESKGELNFVPNPDYYSLLDDTRKDEMFSGISETVQGKAREISDAVIGGDIRKLDEFAKIERNNISEEIKKITKQNILERGCNQEVAENLAKTSVGMSKDDSATQALMFVEEREMAKGKNVLDAAYLDYGAKTSDLVQARGTLAIERGREQKIDRDTQDNIGMEK